MSENDIILNPDEFRRQRREEKQKEEEQKQASPQQPKAAESEAKSSSITTKPTQTKGNTVLIRFETEGRFDLPAKSNFKNYLGRHIDDITLSSREDLLETTCNIVDTLHPDEINEPFTLINALIEEFNEVMMSLKMRFKGTKHIVRWICGKCNKGLDEEEDPIVSDFEIGLDTIQHKSVSQIETEMKEEYRAIWTEHPEEFEVFKQVAFPGHPEIEIEEALQKFVIKEPIIVPGTDGKKYAWEYTRVRHLLKAKDMVDAEFASQFKEIRRRKYSQKDSLVTFKAKQKRDLEKLDREKNKKLIMYSQALSLLSINNVPIKDDFEKIRIYLEELPEDVHSNYASHRQKYMFGVVDERDYICNHCGNVERRFLRRTSTPFDFLPIESVADKQLERVPGATIYFGV